MPGGRLHSDGVQGQVSYVRGVVVDVDTNGFAHVKINNRQEKVRTDLLRGKSAPPLPGEVWLMDKPFGVGWMFAVCIGFSADRDWVTAVPTAPWTSVDAPYLPVGYRKDAEGWVTLCGRVTGGTSGSAALTLPLGYRPEARWVQGVVTVDPSGLVSISSSGAVSLDGVRFYAAR